LAARRAFVERKSEVARTGKPRRAREEWKKEDALSFFNPQKVNGQTATK